MWRWKEGASVRLGTIALAAAAPDAGAPRLWGLLRAAVASHAALSRGVAAVAAESARAEARRAALEAQVEGLDRERKADKQWLLAQVRGRPACLFFRLPRDFPPFRPTWFCHLGTFPATTTQPNDPSASVAPPLHPTPPPIARRSAGCSTARRGRCATSMRAWRAPSRTSRRRGGCAAAGAFFLGRKALGRVCVLTAFALLGCGPVLCLRPPAVCLSLNLPAPSPLPKYTDWHVPPSLRAAQGGDGSTSSGESSGPSGTSEARSGGSGDSGSSGSSGRSSDSGGGSSGGGRRRQARFSGHTQSGWSDDEPPRQADADAVASAPPPAPAPPSPPPPPGDAAAAAAASDFAAGAAAEDNEGYAGGYSLAIDALEAGAGLAPGVGGGGGDAGGTAAAAAADGGGDDAPTQQFDYLGAAAPAADLAPQLERLASSRAAAAAAAAAAVTAAAAAADEQQRPQRKRPADGDADELGLAELAGGGGGSAGGGGGSAAAALGGAGGVARVKVRPHKRRG